MARWFSGISIIKDPDSVLDYKWDFNDADSPWLATGDTIASHVVTADTGITVDASTNDDDSVTVWLSGGTAGTAYTVAVKITTNQGRTVERSVLFIAQEQ